MKHIKKHPINDKLSNLSKDIKKQDHSKPASKKKLDADKSLSDADVSMKVTKPSNKKLDGEKFLADPTINTKKPNKPSNKNLDGEKFLSESFQENDTLSSKLDEVYEILKEEIKSSDIEDFYEAEEMINKSVTKYLGEKLWNDDELSDWMKKREFGE
jgi:hypothetical protein